MNRAFQTSLPSGSRSPQPLVPGPQRLSRTFRPTILINPYEFLILAQRDVNMMQIEQEIVYPAAASACAFIGSVFDVKSRRVPNLLTGPAVLFALLLHLSLGGWRGLADAAGAGLICGLVFLVFYLAGGMGAGDVKLITAVGCLCGLNNVAFVLALTGIAGGVMAVSLALMRGQLRQTFLNVVTLVSHHRSEGLTPHPEINVLSANTLRLPYAVAITAGCALTLWFQGVQR